MIHNLLIDTEVVVEPRLCSPAEVEGREDMVFWPIHDFHQFIPVVYAFKGHEFHRRAGNNHPIEKLVLHLVKGSVKGMKVFLIRVGGLMGGRMEEGHIQLKRRIRKGPKNLGFCYFLGGHKVD